MNFKDVLEIVGVIIICCMAFLSLSLIWNTIEVIISKAKDGYSIFTILENTRKYVWLIVVGILCYSCFFWYHFLQENAKRPSLFGNIYFCIFTIAFLSDVVIGAISLKRIKMDKKHQELEWIRYGMPKWAKKEEYERRAKKRWNLSRIPFVINYLASGLICCILLFCTLSLAEVLLDGRVWNWLLDLIKGIMVFASLIGGVFIEDLLLSGLQEKIEKKFNTIEDNHNRKVDEYNEEIRKYLFDDENEQQGE